MKTFNTKQPSATGLVSHLGILVCNLFTGFYVMKNYIEVWHPIKGYEGRYEVSNLGKIKSLAKGKGPQFNRDRILSIIVNRSTGYCKIKLVGNEKQDIKTYLIHRLVAIAFIDNPENKREVNHIDGDKLNNCVDNLEWCTAKENMHHCWRMGLQDIKGEKCHLAKLTEDEVLSIRDRYKNNERICELARAYHVTHPTVQAIVKRNTWKHI